jgi:hypothetical protein
VNLRAACTHGFESFQFLQYAELISGTEHPFADVTKLKKWKERREEEED